LEGRSKGICSIRHPAFSGAIKFSGSVIEPISVTKVVGTVEEFHPKHELQSFVKGDEVTEELETGDE